MIDKTEQVLSDPSNRDPDHRTAMISNAPPPEPKQGSAILDRIRNQLPAEQVYGAYLAAGELQSAMMALNLIEDGQTMTMPEPTVEHGDTRSKFFFYREALVLLSHQLPGKDWWWEVVVWAADHKNNPYRWARDRLLVNGVVITNSHKAEVKSTIVKEVQEAITTSGIPAPQYGAQRTDSPAEQI